MRNLPCLYKSGIRYAPEPGHGTGVEDFAQPWQTYARGEGDCDDLVIYRVSWLKSRGIRATVTVADFGGMGDQHVQVRLPDGTIEDPSVILGSGNEWPEDFLYDRE
jgi:transglutaminase-like putative cysteine protease